MPLGQTGFAPRPQGTEEPVHVTLFGLAAALQGVVQRRVGLQLGPQPRVRERLHQVLERTVAHGLLDGRDVPRRRHHDHVGAVAEPAQLPHHGQPVAVGHVVVQQDEIHAL